MHDFMEFKKKSDENWLHVCICEQYYIKYSPFMSEGPRRAASTKHHILCYTCNSYNQWYFISFGVYSAIYFSQYFMTTALITIWTPLKHYETALSHDGFKTNTLK